MTVEFEKVFQKNESQSHPLSVPSAKTVTQGFFWMPHKMSAKTDVADVLSLDMS